MIKASTEAEKARMQAALEAAKGQLEASQSENKALSEQVTFVLMTCLLQCSLGAGQYNAGTCADCMCPAA